MTDSKNDSMHDLLHDLLHDSMHDAMRDSLHEKIVEEADALEDIPRMMVPFEVLLNEGYHVAKLMISRWEPTPTLPGLRSAGKKLPETLADEIVTLRKMAHDAENAYQLCVEHEVKPSRVIARAKVVLNELISVIEFYLETGIESDSDALSDMADAGSEEDGEFVFTLSQALYDYATLALPMAAELDGLGNFDGGMIEEAFLLVDQLGEAPAIPDVLSDEAMLLKEKRDRLAGLLQTKIRLVRSAARFVFRDHPEIQRDFACAYECHRHAAARRAKMTKKKAAC